MPPPFIYPLRDRQPDLCPFVHEGSISDFKGELIPMQERR
ncbi:hypothetical protein SAMN05192559_101833 [Halobacillus karajensis]|uniref:Uncharacterized protein n=1 Tax=Halobacillus karajensis TaxID=195088 RepID=A0A059NXB6_9BACI|nr:hypothetical protein BN982_00829 [Halobacillus karajensis]CDQ23373.1 hypothetical protein BN983_01599 [Halobacillus karajensis]CDQ26855.1 hypothetical protein BN981_01079 [Halobacillus karajensis]SEH49976.1 hypothetical protein SAMN05192559_101833 [Halobacillus karajensis]